MGGGAGGSSGGGGRAEVMVVERVRVGVRRRRLSGRRCVHVRGRQAAAREGVGRVHSVLSVHVRAGARGCGRGEGERASERERVCVRGGQGVCTTQQGRVWVARRLMVRVVAMTVADPRRALRRPRSGTPRPS